MLAHRFPLDAEQGVGIANLRYRAQGKRPDQHAYAIWKSICY